jgi:hypothetical protein
VDPVGAVTRPDDDRDRLVEVFDVFDAHFLSARCYQLSGTPCRARQPRRVAVASKVDSGSL